ncbi:hypothetical protein ACFL2A_02060 [Thermodesulfobacteriota bacterium]
MKRVLIITIFLLLLCFEATVFAETDFFGSFDSKYSANDNLTDADKENEDGMSYLETKLILGVESRFDNYLKAVAAFEAGGIIWGIDGESDNEGQNSGGGASGDGINLETKNIYLDLTSQSAPVNFKCGLMPFSIVNDILAGDDAFGASLMVGNDFSGTLNFIRLYQESMGDRYNENEDDPDRRTDFVELEVENKFSEKFDAKLITASLVDRYNGEEGNEINQDIYYGGAEFALTTGAFKTSALYLYAGGKIDESSVAGNSIVDTDVRGYLFDLSSDIDVGAVDFLFEYLYASGDDPNTKDTDEGFIVPETSYKKDIAEILTRGEYSDELTGDDDYYAYKYTMDLNNVFFLKAGIKYQINKKIDTSFDIIYAEMVEGTKITESGRNAHNIGTEFDYKIKYKVYSADDQQKGLSVEFMFAYLLTGDAYDEFVESDSTIDEPSNVHETGIRLFYEF